MHWDTYRKTSIRSKITRKEEVSIIHNTVLPRHDNTERHFFIIKANREYRNAMPKRGRMKSAKVTKPTWTKEMITKVKELVLFQMVSRSRVLLDQLHRPESPPYFPAFRDSNPPSPLPRHSLERSISWGFLSRRQPCSRKQNISMKKCPSNIHYLPTPSSTHDAHCINTDMEHWNRPKISINLRLYTVELLRWENTCIILPARKRTYGNASMHTVNRKRIASSVTASHASLIARSCPIW